MKRIEDHIARSYISCDATVAYTARARKDMERIPPNLRERIRAKLNQLATDPASLANNLSP